MTSLGAAAASGTRLARDRVSRDVEDFIARWIFSGTLAAGDRIDLDAIAGELGVSRIPVREALAALEREGLVSTEFYRGFRVSPLDAAVIHESFELYGLLASLAVRQVTGAADQAELDRLAAVGDAALVSPVSNVDFSRLSYAYRRELHKAGEAGGCAISWRDFAPACRRRATSSTRPASPPCRRRCGPR